MIKPIIQRIIKQLKSADLSLEDRTALTNVLLEKLQVLPLSQTFVIDGGDVLINGKKMEVDQVIGFKDSCLALKDNFARQVIHNQIRYLAINMGVHNTLSLDSTIFMKAALWCLFQEQELIDKMV